MRKYGIWIFFNWAPVVPGCNTNPLKFIHKFFHLYKEKKFWIIYFQIVQKRSLLRHFLIYQKVDGSSLFYIFFFFAFFCEFFAFKRLPQHFREETQEKWPLQTVIYTSKNPWVLKKPTAYGGLLMSILLNKIHIIYVSNATFCHKYSLEIYLKTFRIYCTQ